MGLFNNGGMDKENSGTSVGQEFRRSKIKGWVDVILCIVIVIVVMLYRENTSSQMTKVMFSQEGITLSCTEEDSCTIMFDQFTSVELYSKFSSFDKGEMLRGTDTHSTCTGVFRNEEFGEYYLCVSPKYESCIVVHQPDSVVVFNYESKETTEDAYHFLQQMLDDRQQ